MTLPTFSPNTLPQDPNLIIPIEPAVACTLTDAELGQRKDTLLTQARQHILETKAVPNGYAFRFAPDDDGLNVATTIIGLERKCCSFLHFQLDVSPQHGPIWLKLTGPSGTSAFLEQALGFKDYHHSAT